MAMPPACSVRARSNARPYENIPFRYVASGLHPDHDTIANFRKTFLAEIQELFVQILLLAQTAGVFQLGNISLDGSKIRADASKHHAVSYKRLLELETELRQQVSELFALGEQADQGELTLPPGFSVEEEIAFRQERLAHLAQAKAVLEARAQERDAAEKAAYDAKVREREEKARQNKRPPRGRAPKPPEPGSARRRSIQLYRSRFAHHEEQHRCRFRPTLQCPSRGGPSQFVHRRTRPCPTIRMISTKSSRRWMRSRHAWASPRPRR